MSYQFPEGIDQMEVLDVSNTNFSSFKGLSPSFKLERFLCYNSPIDNHPFLPIEALVVFGDSLVSINNISIITSDRIKAKRLADSIRTYLYEGYTLISLTPLSLADESRQKIVRLSDINDDERKEAQVRTELIELMPHFKKYYTKPQKKDKFHKLFI